jgi:asparagine synthase (glutamine-hydrolysing)
MVAEYLAVRITHKEETLYKDILRLPPAHSLTVKNGQLTKRRYWDINSAQEIRYRSDDEYAEHFIEVFKESVRCCLRSNRTVGAYLSGGLDSSSVVSMVSLIREKEGAANHGFETFSILYPGLPCDESLYIRAVVDRWGIRANYEDLQASSLDLLRGQTVFYRDICDYPNGIQADPLRALAQEKGLRVLLTGDYGDVRLGGSLYYLSDFVRRGNAFALHREMRKQGLPLLSWRGLSTLGHFAIAPVLPESLRKTIRRAKKALVPQDATLGWMDSAFAQRTKIHERLEGMNSEVSIRSSKAWLRIQLDDGGQLHGAELEDRAAARFGIEQRHPFADRRMIELSLGLPENQRLRTDQKYVLRKAMRGVLPELVRQRQDKAEFSETLFRAVRRVRSSAGHKLSCERLGWINGNRARTMQREMEQLHSAGDPAYIQLVWPLWMICALDIWLDGRQSRRSETTPEERFAGKFATA